MFPSTNYNISVFSSGIPQTGKNLQGEVVEIVGSTPPISGMPVFAVDFPVGTPQWVILAYDNFGLITIGASGAVNTPVVGLPGMNDNLFRRVYPWQVYTWDYIAASYGGWPTSTGSIQFSNPSFSLTGVGPVRSNSFYAGATGVTRDSAYYPFDIG